MKYSLGVWRCRRTRVDEEMPLSLLHRTALLQNVCFSPITLGSVGLEVLVFKKEHSPQRTQS